MEFFFVVLSCAKASYQLCFVSFSISSRSLHFFSILSLWITLVALTKLISMSTPNIGGLPSCFPTSLDNNLLESSRLFGFHYDACCCAEPIKIQLHCQLDYRTVLWLVQPWRYWLVKTSLVQHTGVRRNQIFSTWAFITSEIPDSHNTLSMKVH